MSSVARTPRGRCARVVRSVRSRLPVRLGGRKNAVPMLPTVAPTATTAPLDDGQTVKADPVETCREPQRHELPLPLPEHRDGADDDIFMFVSRPLPLLGVGFPDENVPPLSALKSPPKAPEHVKKYYAAGTAAKVMEAELVALSETDTVVRLELFARLIHYVDSELERRGTSLNRPPRVSRTAQEWALAEGMPAVIRSRTEMLLDFRNFSDDVPADLTYLPPDGSLNAVYKHAMREDLHPAVRLELIDEMFDRSEHPVRSQWSLVRQQRAPLPMLGRVYRQNHLLFARSARKKVHRLFLFPPVDDDSSLAAVSETK